MLDPILLGLAQRAVYKQAFVPPTDPAIASQMDPAMAAAAGMGAPAAPGMDPAMAAAGGGAMPPQGAPVDPAMMAGGAAPAPAPAQDPAAAGAAPPQQGAPVPPQGPNTGGQMQQFIQQSAANAGTGKIDEKQVMHQILVTNAAIADSLGASVPVSSLFPPMQPPQPQQQKAAERRFADQDAPLDAWVAHARQALRSREDASRPAA